MASTRVPGADWERVTTPGPLLAAANDLCADDSLGVTLALVVVRGGRMEFEHYAPDPTPNPFRTGPPPATTAETTLISWSMAKSMTHSLVGLIVDPEEMHAPLAAPEWRGSDKESITWQQLLNMRSGLSFVEDYVDGEVSDVIEMLFGAGQHDVAAYAAARPLIHQPGSVWNYSSGTTNIITRRLGQLVGGPDALRAYLDDRLFDAIGMRSATAKFDDAGTFIGSSFVYATAPDFARFGLLHLRDGVWDGRRILPIGWVDHARRPTPVPADEPHGYGAHWWLWPYENSFAAHGYEGQRIIVLPDRDAVVVRLGKTPESMNDALRFRLDAVIGALA
jgi:CubicO group peptidase (beta-lactamase class C family)